jgi:hypothetical protein
MTIRSYQDLAVWQKAIKLVGIAYHFFIALELGYLTQSQLEVFFNKSAEVGRILHGLVDSLKQPPAPGTLKPETWNLPDALPIL